MRPSRDSQAPLLLPFLLPVALGLTLDCNEIQVSKRLYNLSPLKGPHSVSYIDRSTDPGYYNTTFTIGLCENLPIKDDIPKTDQCKEMGTRVCGIKRSQNPKDGTDTVAEVIEVAGDYPLTTGRSLDPKWEHLKGSKSNADQDRDGLRLELHGGKYPPKTGLLQKAIIEFVCDPDRTGNEDDDPNPHDMDGDGSGDDNGDAERAESQDNFIQEKKASNRSLIFIDYKNEEEFGVLRLSWRTKYVCEELVNGPREPSARWGFFTWLIIIVFLGASSYLIFGAWLNYNRYGARGWDLVPHGDTIRDIPYLVKDWARTATSAIQGPSPRGGYSAV